MKTSSVPLVTLPIVRALLLKSSTFFFYRKHLSLTDSVIKNGVTIKNIRYWRLHSLALVHATASSAIEDVALV